MCELVGLVCLSVSSKKITCKALRVRSAEDT